MSGSRRKFTTEYKVEAAHRVIDSGRPIAEVARELGIMEQSLGAWVRDERRRVEAAQAGLCAGEGPGVPGKSSGVLRQQPTKA